ncbi:hypothetical protein HW132_10230 [Brasilonema sp. CT11]|nr:hypothetical protein [Brasilonema sp. CT11]
MTLDKLKQFRTSAYTILGNAKDALFDLMDAVLVTRSVYSFAELSCSPVFRRQWSSIYVRVRAACPLATQRVPLGLSFRGWQSTARRIDGLVY